ncbi:hypothetical protein [Bacteroides sp. 519]|uniref:hypothetical protein n=1 Tax=Bacteroides sp. 519 TaxID=2302937 RepID=UPI0013D66A53|nr:hypothetical protein [Bacteroides sp. 519]NDV58782.1 hypothetical protein [Bacteroides sp. 519]
MTSIEDLEAYCGLTPDPPILMNNNDVRNLLASTISEIDVVGAIYDYIDRLCDSGSNMSKLTKPQMLFYIGHSFIIDVSNGAFAEVLDSRHFYQCAKELDKQMLSYIQKNIDEF